MTWGQKNRERYREYNKALYHRKLKEQYRRKRFEGRKCRLCEILLKSEYGSHNKKFYCDGCVESGEARKHSKRLASKKIREKRKLDDK